MYVMTYKKHINENIVDDAKQKMNTFKSLFSIKSWLASTGGKSDENKKDDPVKAAYLETLKKKRENAERRHQQLADARAKLKATGIKTQFELQDAAAENMHQNILKQIDAQQKELEQRLQTWKNINAKIKKGKTLPQDLLETAVKENDKDVQAIVNGLSPDDRSVAQKAQDAFMEAYYKPEYETDENGKEDTSKPKFDKDGNPIVKPRTALEFKTYLSSNQALQTAINAVAGEGRQKIEEMNDEQLEQFAETIDAASPSTKKDKAEAERAKKQEAFEEASALKEKIKEEVENCNKKNDAVERAFKVKGELASAEDAENKAKTIKDDVKKAIALKLINDNKSKEPFKSIIAADKLNECVDELSKCTDDKGNVNLSNVLKNLTTKFPDETGKMEKDENGDKKLPENLNGSTVQINVEQAKTKAEQEYQSAVEKTSEARIKVTESNTELADLKIDDTGTKENPKKFLPKFDDTVKNQLSEFGIKPNAEGEYDPTVVTSTLDAQVKQKKTDVENANKEIQELEDQQKSINAQYKTAVADNEKQKINDNDRDFIDDVKKMSKDKQYSISTAEKTDEHGDVYVEKADGTKLSRPKDITNEAEMKKYQNAVKVAMIKQYMSGDQPEPPHIETELDDKGNPVHYKVNPDGKKEQISDNEEAKQIAAKHAQFERCRAEVYDTLNNMDKEENDDIRKEIQKIIDENPAEAEKYFKDEDIDMTDFDFDDDTIDDDEEGEDEAEKELREAKKKLGDMSEDKILELADKDPKPDGVTDAQYEAARKYKDAKKKLDAQDEQDDDAENNDDKTTKDAQRKPLPPKRKIRKRPSKRKGFSVYIYKDQNGKIQKTSKKDWQANVRAWKKYKRRLAKWEKTNSTRNESFITKVLSKKLVVERFCPKDLTSYLKECF